MNKNLVALAVAAAVTAPMVAQADVTVYGRVQAEYNIEDRDGSDSMQGIDDNAGQSRIGVKFSEKLGGGLKAFGKAEFRIDPADNTSSGTGGSAPSISGALGQRDIHAGIKSSWGSLAIGSFHAPYKTTGGVKWDPFTATHLQARRAGGMSGGAGIGGHNGFMRNAVYYTSPNMSGFQVRFAISPDETNSGARNGPDDADNDYSISLSYKNGPWQAIVAHNRNNQDPASDEKLTKVGLRWKHGAHTVAGQYEWIDNCTTACGGSAPGGGAYSSVGSGDDGDLIWLNYQYKWGNNILSASWGNTEGDSSGSPDNDYWALGIIHKFSKQTRLFAGYTETDSNVLADRDAWTVGFRKDF